MSRLSSDTSPTAAHRQQLARPLDVQRCLGGLLEVGEHRRERIEERRLGGRELGVVQALVQHPRAEAEADQPLVEVAGGPVGQAGVDRALEGEHPLGHAAGGGDHHHHQHLGLEGQHLDVADRGGLDRRRGDDRQQVGDLRQRLGGDAHRLVELAAHQRQRQRRPRRRLGEQAVDEVAVARPRWERGRQTCAGAPAAPAPRGWPARGGSSTVPTRTRRSAPWSPRGRRRRGIPGPGGAGRALGVRSASLKIVGRAAQVS